MDRKAWMDQEAPPNYVAGLGRGATGFTTRSDIGPARAPTAADAIMNGLPTAGIAAPAMHRDADDDDKEDYSESNYDAFEGYGGSFNDPNAVYDEDDRAADAVWESVDERMDSRRRERREAKLKAEMEKYRQSRPKIQQQFADLKRELSGVSMEEWDSIPDIADHTQRHKKKAKGNNFSFLPVPDSVLEKSRQDNQNFSSLDPLQQKFGGLETPMMDGGITPITDLTQIGAGRTKVLTMTLDKKGDSVEGQTVVDPKGYLTDLNSLKINSADEVGDIKKARLLLKSVRTTNPKHAPGWIASARLEEVAAQLTKARKLINQACQVCPDSEDVWIEAARLNTPENAKILLARAIEHVPKSVKVWTQAAALEEDINAKKRVLRKALEFVPASVKLWKAAVELEEPEDARIMLTRAVECVPHSVEMWLALAHLETYENARKVLNKARLTIPTDSSIWITAAKLEEAHNNEEGVKNIIKRAVKSLAQNNVVISRDQWIKDAEAAEKAGSVITCQAIIHETIGVGVDDEDRKRTWVEDAESSIAHGCIETARAIYAHALTVFPGKKSLWLRVAHLEKTHGTRESLDNTLKKAVAYCPQAETLWLMAAKENWLAGNVDRAREILGNAFNANPDSEQIWLAAVKLESENNELDRARSLLARARQGAGTERVWMKSALLEREVGNTEEERNLLEMALQKYPQFPKFWMMRGQLEERLNNLEAAREIYTRGLKNCIHSIPLWLVAVQLEGKVSTAKARSLLEKGRLKNPKNPELWIAAIRIERRDNNPKMAQNLMSKALQECPNSGILWAEAIEMESLPQKKARSVDALKKCDNDPVVIVAVAKIFWADGKLDKARSWLNRAVTLNSDLGDAWAYFYRFELQHGTEEQQQAVLKRCVEAEPHHGEKWTKVSKDIKNSRLRTEAILKKVAASLEAM